MYCKYKDFFGEVNTGIHSYRIFNIAIFDVIFTFLAAFIIHLIIPNYNYFIILIAKSYIPFLEVINII